MKTKPQKQHFDPMYKNSANWKWIFYYNPRDSRVLVPKLNSKFGWTFNFGNKFTYIGIIIVVLIIVAFKLFG